MNRLFISTIFALSLCTSCSNITNTILHRAEVKIVEEKDTVEYSINVETKDSIVSQEDFDKLSGKSWIIGWLCNFSTPNTCIINIKRTNLNINRRGYYVSFTNTRNDTAYYVHVKIKVKNKSKEYFKDVSFVSRLCKGYKLYGIAWLDDNETVIPPAKISWN